MSATQEPTAPKLSVIVPVYNSTAFLEKCLNALAKSLYDDFEVIVVDDGSTEPVEYLVARFGFKYTRIDGPGGPARARNYGVKLANGRYVVFVDADVCVHPDVLARFSAAFEADPQLAAVIGSYDDSPAEPNFLSQYKNLFHHFVHQRNEGVVHTFWCGCGAIRKDLFLSFGGFDEQRYRRPAIEDIELGTWISAAGYKIILDKRITGTHQKHWTLHSICSTDIFDRGIPWTRLMLRAGAVANTLNVKHSQRISVLLVYLTLLFLLASIWWSLAWLGVAALVLAVTIINLDFYRYFAAHRGWWFALRAAPMHWLYFGYCGFCVCWGTILHYLSADSAIQHKGSKRQSVKDEKEDSLPANL